MKAAEERTHTSNTMLAELQRHTGAGGFVWSSTEEDDLPITRDLAVPLLQFLRRNLQCAGKGARIGQDVERMAQVTMVTFPRLPVRA